ncbi:hypothetical protein LX64_01043 [Chitinophaga skermanii]|uniref:Uncharacterized protein n=1 Tax=Chitinophaga skermanii TaxID=331697 RepID=A0A327QXM3_9BACT|nr:hypothetical protein LX64_01043 [Chitinophaga skermanii]
MRAFRFLIKVCFICNLCSLGSLWFLVTEQSGDLNTFDRHIVVMGMVIAAPLNILAILWLLVLLLRKKLVWKDAHPILFVFNCIVLLFQLGFFP